MKPTCIIGELGVLRVEEVVAMDPLHDTPDCHPLSHRSILGRNVPGPLYFTQLGFNPAVAAQRNGACHTHPTHPAYWRCWWTMEAPVGSVPLLGYRQPVNPAPEETAQGGVNGMAGCAGMTNKHIRCAGVASMEADDQDRQTTRSACVWQAAYLFFSSTPRVLRGAVDTSA